MAESLILLDLSATFDIIDHFILLHRLEKWFGILGTALEWFKSYFQNCAQTVYCNGAQSNSAKIDSGVLQESVLGPLLFTRERDQDSKCLDQDIRSQEQNQDIRSQNKDQDNNFKHQDKDIHSLTILCNVRKTNHNSNCPDLLDSTVDST